MSTAVLHTALISFVATCAVRHFGYVDGAAITCAIYLLMPYAIGVRS